MYRLMHISFWFGTVREPSEWAWYPDEHLGWINHNVNQHELHSIYDEDALTLGVF